MNRMKMLSQMRETAVWDLVIIGGGATGLGCAVDAASRGYRTLLLEQYDLAKASSSRATKLVHGGVRYLAQGNIKLVMEALRERSYLLQNAPDLTSILGFVVPVYRQIDKWFYGVGLKCYDLLSGKFSLGKTEVLNKKQTLEKLPGIQEKGLKGGILYFDGQFDDAALAIALAATAVSHGATVLNYCRAESFTKTNGRITGASIKDELSDQEYFIQAKAFINATGVFTDTIIRMDDPAAMKIVEPSQGTHLVVDRLFFPGSRALLIPKTEDGRVLFAVPWHGKVILGTTDTPVDRISIEPRPLEEEIDFILRHANRYLEGWLSRRDVLSLFAGLRPLIKKKGTRKTSVLSRDHTILLSNSGLVTVTGGKWTTYRRMAEDAVDHASAAAGLPRKACVTKNLPIGSRTTPAAGTFFLQHDFSPENKSVAYYIDQEMAATVEDILARRKRVLFLDARAALQQAPQIAREMATHLQLDETWVNEQITQFSNIAKNYFLPD
jgi:glycerol-3-phosphate dehydrogenase